MAEAPRLLLRGDLPSSPVGMLCSPGLGRGDGGEQVAGSKEQGARSKEQGARSKEQGARSRKAYQPDPENGPVIALVPQYFLV